MHAFTAPGEIDPEWRGQRAMEADPDAVVAREHLETQIVEARRDHARVGENSIRVKRIAFPAQAELNMPMASVGQLNQPAAGLFQDDPPGSDRCIFIVVNVYHRGQRSAALGDFRRDHCISNLKRYFHGAIMR